MQRDKTQENSSAKSAHPCETPYCIPVPPQLRLNDWKQEKNIYKIIIALIPLFPLL